MKAHLITVGVLVLAGLFVWSNVVWGLWPVVIVCAIGVVVIVYTIVYDLVSMELTNRQYRRYRNEQRRTGK